jgi:hypothetical protein
MAVRTFKAALAALLGLLALGLPLAPAPAGAALTKGIDLALVPGTGVLNLRDAEEPGVLQTPTTVTGAMAVDEQTGAISGASLNIAPMSFEFDITTPVDERVYVDAVFTEVTPGTVTGKVTKLGDNQATLTLRASVRVDLHVEVRRPNPMITSDCTATPIPLEFNTTVPYDKTAKTVTLTDANFTVPPVPQGGDCADAVRDGVNVRLAGSGHSITMQMQGDLYVPTTGEASTTTSLNVTPAASEPGDEVVLTSTVARTTPPGGAPTPTGFVGFYDGEVEIATAALDGAGTATLATTDLSVGAHQLTARYLGDDTYFFSTSPIVEHTVAAEPTVTIAMGTTVLIAGPQPRLATLTVDNSADFSKDVENLRVDFMIARTGLTSNAALDNRIKVEWFNAGAWELVPYTATEFQKVEGTIGPNTGFALPAGTKQTIHLRISVRVDDPGDVVTPHETTCNYPHPTCPGPAALTTFLREVNPGTGEVVEPIEEKVHNFSIVESIRRLPNFTFTTGFPRPHTVRQGYTTQVFGTTTAVGGLRGVGTVSVFLDGEPIPVRGLNAPVNSDGVLAIPVVNGSINAFLTTPHDIEPGTHNVTVRYSGDLFFSPFDKSTTLTVLPTYGAPDNPSFPFLCREEGFTTKVVDGTNVQFDVTLPPAVVNGASTDIEVSAAVLRHARQRTAGLSAPWAPYENGTTTTIGTIPLTGPITFDFGENGTGTAQALERQGGTTITGPNPGNESTVDQTITLHDPSAALTVEGEPGDVVPIELEEISIQSLLNATERIVYTMTCTPVGGPVVLGEVEIAGTEVTATPSPAREITDEVTLEASTFPEGAAGTVSFASNVDGALGSDAVSSGEAELATDELSPGVHEITASFNATNPDIPDTSGTTTVVVTYSPRTGRQAFVIAARTDFTGAAAEDAVLADASALAGGQTKSSYLTALSRTNAYLTHVVNQMYLDTLGREGDADGVEYWVGQLQAGVPVAKVAASFYGSPEYYARAGGTDEAWVNDLYETLLGRTADDAGRTYWIGQIPVRTKGGVAHAFFQTEESGRFRVADLYDFFLDREPSEADLDYWTPVVLSRGDLVLAVFLASSDEYADLAEERFPVVED